MIATKKKDVSDVWGQIDKAFAGSGPSNMFDSKTVPEIESISTGCPVVDESTGIWGIPRGRIIQFAGQKSSGKTMLSLSCIAQAQKQFPNAAAVFIDAESTFDFDWAQSMGVDISPDRFKVIKENDGVKVFEGLVGRPSKTKPGTKQFKGILDFCLDGELEVCMIVLDSVAKIKPPMEVDSVVGKANIALLPRFLGPELRTLTPLLERTKIPMIFINQVRVEPGKMFGDPEMSPGGSALKHDLSMMIHLAMINGKAAKIFGNNETQIGHKVRARIDKNKVGPPFRQSEFDIIYINGIVNKHCQVADLGIKYGIIDRPNNTTYMLNGESLRGRQALDDFLKYNTGACSDILDKVQGMQSDGFDPAMVEKKTKSEEEES